MDFCGCVIHSLNPKSLLSYPSNLGQKLWVLAHLRQKLWVLALNQREPYSPVSTSKVIVRSVLNINASTPKPAVLCGFVGMAITPFLHTFDPHMTHYTVQNQQQHSQCQQTAVLPAG